MTPTESSNNKKKGRMLRCTHCGKEWLYGGGMSVNATCTDCNLHTNIKDSLMMITLIASLAVLGGLGMVFADEVTLETSFPIYEYSCLEDSTEQYPYAECYIQGQKFFINNADGLSYSWDPIEEKYVPTEQLIEEAKQLYQDSIAVEDAPESTPSEKRLTILTEKTNPTDSDLEEIEFLKHLETICASTTKVSQTYREYPVLYEMFLDLDGTQRTQLLEDFSVSTSNLKNESPESRAIKMGIQECIAQPYTMKSPNKLPQFQQYAHIGVDDEYTDYFTHQDTAIGIEPFPMTVLTEADFQATQDAAKDVICKSNIYRENFKKDYGCDPELTYDGTGVRKYQSDAEDAYVRYQNEGDTEQLLKAKRAALIERLQSLK